MKLMKNGSRLEEGLKEDKIRKKVMLVGEKGPTKQLLGFVGSWRS